MHFLRFFFTYLMFTSSLAVFYCCFGKDISFMLAILNALSETKIENLQFQKGFFTMFCFFHKNINLFAVKKYLWSICNGQKLNFCFLVLTINSDAVIHNSQNVSEYFHFLRLCNLQCITNNNKIPEKMI